MCDDYPDQLYAVKNKSPLIIGVGDNENYIASDVPAILDKTRKYIVLEDGDYAKLTNSEIKLYHDGKNKDYKVELSQLDASSVDKQGYPHYMLKEIHEQPGGI